MFWEFTDPQYLKAKLDLIDITELHRYLEGQGFKPMVVIVGNERARILVYFNKELSNNEKLKLQEALLGWYRKWIGVESS
jgi:hypothetical protein